MVLLNNRTLGYDDSKSIIKALFLSYALWYLTTKLKLSESVNSFNYIPILPKLNKKKLDGLLFLCFYFYFIDLFWDMVMLYSPSYRATCP